MAPSQIKMTAEAAQGLVDLTASQDNSFKEFEDPARCYIDLVLAFKSGDPEQVRDCLTQVKASHWTHDLWNAATAAESETEEEDDDDPFYTPTDADNVKKWQHYADAQDEFWEE